MVSMFRHRGHDYHYHDHVHDHACHSPLCSSALLECGLRKNIDIFQFPGNRRQKVFNGEYFETFLKCSILRVLGLAPETTATRLELKSLSAM